MEGNSPKFDSALAGTWPTVALAVLAASLWAQTVKPAYVESFRKGATRVSEEKFAVKLTSDNVKFEAQIKDSAGNDRYSLSLTPARVDESDARIRFWRVTLLDLKRRALGNLLVSSPGAEAESSEAKDHAWVLDANPYAVVPLSAQRVFKVESFYCRVQVQEHHLLRPDQLLLDSMRVEVQFTNTNPLEGSRGD